MKVWGCIFYSVWPVSCCESVLSQAPCSALRGPPGGPEDRPKRSSAAGQRRRLSWETNFKWLENGENARLASLTGLPGPLLTPLSLSIQQSIMGLCTAGASGRDGICGEVGVVVFELILGSSSSSFLSPLQESNPAAARYAKFKSSLWRNFKWDAGENLPTQK